MLGQFEDELLAIIRTNFNQDNIRAFLDRVGERERSRGDCSKNRRCFRAVERLVHHIAKSPGPDFHRPDFVNHNKLLRMYCCSNGFDASLKRREIESIFSHALCCFEIHMRKHSLFTCERNDFEPDPLAALADFLGVKTASRSRELVHHALNQSRFPAPWST